MLLALFRAYHDRVHPEVHTQGLEERDLGYEANLLTPPEVELPLYATQKRRRILRGIRRMVERGWATVEARPPHGTYYVCLTAEGERFARQLARPWWRRVWERLRPGRADGRGGYDA